MSEDILKLAEIYAAFSDGDIKKVAFIEKEKGQYVIKSKKGKKLSKKIKTKAEARKRLREIEYFKNKDKNDAVEENNAHDETFIEDGKPVVKLVSHGE
jgi:hypothetical protein